VESDLLLVESFVDTEELLVSVMFLHSDNLNL